MNPLLFRELAAKASAGDFAALDELKSTCPPVVAEFLGNPIRQGQLDIIETIAGENPLVSAFLSDHVKQLRLTPPWKNSFPI